MTKARNILIPLSAKIGMGDRNQQLGSFTEGATVQIHGPVFGHDPLNVAPRRDDSGAGIEHRDDSRERAFFGRGGKRDDRQSVP